MQQTAFGFWRASPPGPFNQGLCPCTLLGQSPQTSSIFPNVCYFPLNLGCLGKTLATT